MASHHPLAFEVRVNNVLVFSKLEQGSFPPLKEVVGVVEAAARGEEVARVGGREDISCSWIRWEVFISV